MEDHTDTTERRESLVNLMIRGPREDQNEDNFITNSRDGGSSGDEFNSPHGISSKRHKYNRMLQQENEKLFIEYIAMKEVMENSICDPCHNKETIRNENVDDKEILNEHIRLKNELTRIAIHANKFLGPSTFLEGSLNSMMENFGLELVTERDETSDINVVDDLSLYEVDFGKYLSNSLPTNLVNKDVTLDKSMLLNLALDSLNELLKLAMSYESFWVRSLDGAISQQKPLGHLDGNSLALIEMLMNESQWVEMFPCIIGKVNTFDVISTSIGESKSGTLLKLNYKLFQMWFLSVKYNFYVFVKNMLKVLELLWMYLSTQSKKVRNKIKLKNVEDSLLVALFKICLMVIWIEHMEYDEIFVHHVYLPLIKVGLGFGAQRWMSSLQRQSEFLRVMASFVCQFHSFFKGRDRYENIGSTHDSQFLYKICATSHKLNTIQKENGKYANLMMWKNIRGPGELIGVVLSATKTIQLPIKPQCLFELFTNENMRSQWNILSYSGPMKNIIHISKGQNLESCVSMLCANGDDIISNKNNMLIFQNTCTDATCFSFNLCNIPDLSQDYSINNNNGGNNNEFCSGSLVTIRFQMLVDNLTTTIFQRR
ncbi:hypothetical protein H5410_014160 [Solanum commersonii]|uniref:START domain-containing protein n=1 Tax=Solanum commersonii TaxID=4109 RepID=A0A9J5ZQ78_SOLCO|nr:hypothetical protein H5410_014160 [Solanum commersonii]